MLSDHTREWVFARIIRATTAIKLRQLRDDLGDEAASDPLVKIELMKRETEILK